MKKFVLFLSLISMAPAFAECSKDHYGDIYCSKAVDGGAMTDRAAVAVADWFIDRYENDIATAILYGIYLKAGGHLQLHSTGEPMEYHEFKEGAEYLLNLDLVKVEAAIQGNLGTLTHGLIERQTALAHPPKHVVTRAVHDPNEALHPIAREGLAQRADDRNASTNSAFKR